MSSVRARVPVVSAFVYKGDRVALIKRSEDVGTYRGAWAGFSGYVERLPLNQALVELAEEANLLRDQAHLNGIGIPLAVDDPESDHSWLVFPFLFELADGVEIKTDWETDEWGWFTLDELSDLNTVPGLERALKSVWPPFGDREFWNGLAEVATDTEHGVTELAERGLVALGGFVQAHWDNLNRHRLLRVVRAFAACRPAIGVFPDLAARLLLAIEREGGQYDLDELVTVLIESVEDVTVLSAESASEGLRNKRRLFTLSHSEAVRDTITAWHTDVSEVIVAESGPGLEGIGLFDHLSRFGLSVELVSDSEIEDAVRRVDAVVVGCDAITETNELLNKAGTRAAVETAAEVGIPAYAVAQTFKIAPSGWPVFLEMQSPEEVNAPPGTAVEPVTVFDLTPLDAFEAIFTDEGVLTPERLAEIRAELDSVELIPGA